MAASPIDRSLKYLTALVSLSEPELAACLAGLPEVPSGIHDLIDLAEFVASDENIEDRLAHTTAPLIEALQHFAPGMAFPEPLAAEGIHALFLERKPGEAGIVLLPGVREQLARRPKPFVAPPVSEGIHAQDATAICVQALRLLRAAPYPTLQSNTIPMNAAGELAEMYETDPHLIRAIVDALIIAGFLAVDDPHIARTETGDAWVAGKIEHPWADVLSAAWQHHDLETFARDLHPAPADFTTFAKAAAAHWPYSAGWFLPALAQLHETWLTFGVLDISDRFSPLGASWLADPTTEPPAAQTVDYCYIQDDLRVLVPGIASAPLAHRLAAIAEPLQLVQAETYQITSASLCEALQRGATIDSLTETLQSMTPTELPQPLSYMLETLRTAFGTVMVHSDHGDVTIVVTDDSTAARIGVDRGLNGLGLTVLTEHTFLVQTDARTTVTTLRHEHYPAALDGAVPDQPTVASPPRPEPPDYPALAHAMHSAANTTSPDRTRRILSWAADHHAGVNLTLALPGGQTKSLSLIPRSVQKQRFRALDTDHEVEHTLPIRAITSLHLERATWDQ